MTNRVRIQALPVAVPPEEPFKNDLLGRKAFAETLSDTLGAIEGPGVFAIDGRWGIGKTTFVRMFLQHLRNQGFRVVRINAWDTDYAQDPLAALVSNVAALDAESSQARKFKQAGAKLLKVIVPAVTRIATSGILDLDAAIEKGAGDVLGKLAESRLARYEDHAKSMSAFKETLAKLAAPGEGKPLVIVVDELDRCRPTYAVEMLETIKHAFDVDNVLFVLALNRQQLDQSATTLYGESLETESYFKRFFDVEVKLPEGDKEAVVKTILRQFRADGEHANVDLLSTFLGRSPYTIRMIKRTLLQYAMVSFSMQSYQRDGWWWIPPVVVLLRLAVEQTFRDFVAHRVSDARLADDFFARDWTKPLRGTSIGRLVEATVAAVASDEAWRATSDRPPSELLSRYEGDDAEHSRELLRTVAQMRDTMLLNGFRFNTVVERVETFDTSNLGDTLANH